MQQFYFTFNCQELQSTRNCIIYNHLNLSWKYGDVNLKCMMRHIIFQNSFQRLCEQNGVETLELAQFEVQGDPSWPGLWGCICMEWRWASGNRHGPGKYTRGQHVKSPGSPSHSTFHPQHDLEGPTSLPEVFMLLLGEKKAVSRGHNIPETMVALVVENPPASIGGITDSDSIPGWGRSPGGGHGNPLQDSCLENPMARGAWRDTIHGLTKSDGTDHTHTHTHTPAKEITWHHHS